MSNFGRILGTAINISERVFWVLAGAMLDYCRQVYRATFRSRWGWLYVVLLLAVVLVLTVVPHS